jgi:predicted outer membrane repeat protein
MTATGLLALILIQLLTGSNGLAQNITNFVALGGSVDIPNNSGNRWYFFSAPTPAGSSMARVSSDFVAVYTWPDPANFTADPGDYELDRIFQGEYLRVYAGALPANTLITIPYATPLPGNGPYYFYIIVSGAPYVTAINIIDPSPTAASTVHWSVTFSAAISGVTATNFTLTNPDGLSGATITSVTGSGSNWVVAASTGTGTGLLGCSYVGHASESPDVPTSFTGQQYTFSQYPLVTLEPVSSNIVTGSSYTMTVAGMIRGGGTGGVNYQWYAGTSVNPGAATAISGATSASYTVSGLAAGSTHQYFCRVIASTNTSYTTDSTTATVNVFTPVAILAGPASTAIASGQTKLLTISVSGTSPNFQWYQGVSGDTSTPVGSNSPSFTTPVLIANTSYWVLVSNGLPAAYNQNSATATVRVVTSFANNGPLAVLVNEAFLPAPAFTVLDSASVPVTNYPVTLTINEASAGGSFGGLTNITAISDATGTASAVLTANGLAGPYTVTATTSLGVTSTIALLNVAQLAVDTVTDEDNGSIDPSLGTGLSLREAVNYAATHSGAHTITFASALTSGGPATLNLISGPLSLAGTTTVIGLGAGSLILNGGGSSRLFSIASGANVGLNSMTLTNGHSDASNNGGALVNSGTLVISNCSLAGNVVAGTGSGGAIENLSKITLTGCTLSGNSAGFAGAIRNDGICTLQNCTFSSNSVPSNGGAVENISGAVLNILHCTFSGNSAATNGGAIYNYLSTLNLTNSIVAGNTNGDIYNWSASTVNAGGSNIVQVLVNAGTLVGTNTILAVNPHLAPLGNYGGPTLTMTPLPGSSAIDAAPFTTLLIDQRGYSRVFGPAPDLGAVEFEISPIVTTAADSGIGSLRYASSYATNGALITFATNLSGATIQSSGTLTLNKRLTIDASALPGGITINGNQAGSVFLVTNGNVVLTGLTITNGNASSAQAGGGILNAGVLTVNQCTLAGNSASIGGGGIVNYYGTLVVNESTLAGNSAEYGGGIYNIQGAVTVNQSTLTGNSGNEGGGIINQEGSITVNQSTLTGNIDPSGVAGGLYNFDELGSITLFNSIVAGNTLPNTSGYDSQTINPITSGIASQTGANLTNGTPLLAPLGNYGGPTPTMPPLPGSPAIDGCTNGTTFTTDQRGYPRVLGRAPDIGAVEGVYNAAGPGKLKNVAKLGNGAVSFTLTNYSDMSFTVLTSTNVALPFNQWSNLGTALESPLGSGQYLYLDTQATNYSRRFYTIQSP